MNSIEKEVLINKEDSAENLYLIFKGSLSIYTKEMNYKGEMLDIY